MNWNMDRKSARNWRSAVALCVLVLLGAAIGFACSTAARLGAVGGVAAPSGPVEVSPRVVELGRIGPVDCGADASVINLSKTPILIRRVVPSCWCVSGVCNPSIIPPGQRAELSIFFHGASFRGQSGSIDKTLTLEFAPTGAGSPGRVAVAVRGRIVAAVPVLAFPGILRFSHLAAGRGAGRPREACPGASA